ncbi:L,D-transpeptidase family protein [Patescibacteria group bacterium]|nr:L,D-transpeptidase family protein [Patescibacteria group bacterium]
MKKLFSFFLIFFFLIFGIFVAPLIFPQTIIIEPPIQDFFSDKNSNSIFSTSADNQINKQKEPFYLKIILDIKNDFVAESKSFLEVNFSEMKMRLYKDGKSIKEVPILARGDIQGWGGSAVGLYKILSGNNLSFSVVSEVYMPYALHYYGKYYIHGEPYYPGGEKRFSSITGGCVQLSDKNAKDIYELSEIDMPVLVIDKEKDNYHPSIKNLSDFPEISAKSYLAADLDSGFVFAEKNSQEQLPIASLTKLMLATIVAENVDLKKSILTKPEWLEAGYGVTKGLDAGKNFRVVELFYPLLIQSSNDAAETLSHFLGREKTIKLMNEKTKSILMEKTIFVDPSGFDLKNISTAQDLFSLARYILNVRPLFLEITKGKKVRSFGEVSFNLKDLYNKNIFFDDPNFIGGKTGFLKQSRYNALFIFKFFTDNKQPRDIVIILLGSEDNKIDTQKIYKWLQENYHLSPAF